MGVLNEGGLYEGLQVVCLYAGM